MQQIVLVILQLLVAVSTASSVNLYRKHNYNLSNHSSLQEEEEKQQPAQTLTCYDLEDQGGDALQAIDYIADLANYDFDNMISSCCFQGIWMLYDKSNYNAEDFFVRPFIEFGGDFQVMQTLSPLF